MAIFKGFHNSYVLANGVRTHYSWAGTEGPAVILLHGAGPGACGAAGWRLMLPALLKRATVPMLLTNYQWASLIRVHMLGQ